MSRTINCKRLLAILLSVAVVLAFMPLLGGVNSANASVKKIKNNSMSFTRDAGNGPVYYYVYESEEDEWEDWEPDFGPDDYITYNGTTYRYDYDDSDETQKGHWDFLKGDDSIGIWYIKKKW